MAILHTPQPHEPWNKGKLIGQKAPLKLKDIWAIRIGLQLGHKIRDLALFNLAIDSKLRACDLVKCGCRTSPTVDRSRLAPWSCSRRPAGQSSSRSPNWHGKPYRHGSPMLMSRPRVSFSPAEYRTRPTCQRGSTPGLSIAGWKKPGLSPVPTARTRCAGPKLR